MNTAEQIRHLPLLEGPQFEMSDVQNVEKENEGEGLCGRVECRGGASAGQEFVIRMGQRFVLGRESNSIVKIDDDLVSRAHVALELSPEGLRVTDLKSRNGTYLDSDVVPADRPALVDSEAILCIGRHEFLLTVSGSRAGTRRIRHSEEQFPPEGFEVLGLIGKGGSGLVYAAHQPDLARNVAIKIMHPDPKVPEWRERFDREVGICCRVVSPNVVRVHSIRRSGDKVCMIMELVNGPSLNEVLQKGPTDIPTALRIGEDIARGLAAIHQAEVIHRDVKPANILLAEEGVAKLSDFGIAKDLRTLDENRLTDPGAGLGTYCFVSPEQLNDASSVDERADIYGLGATLYAAIAGKPPPPVVRGPRVLRLIANSGPVALQSICPACPTEIAGLVDRMLAENPADRPAKADLVAEEIQRLRAVYYQELPDGLSGCATRIG